jgi:hypothetical protein
MFNFFKNSVLEWSEYRPFKLCERCGRLQKPFIGDFDHDNCPDCGSRDINNVVARWGIEANYKEGEFILRDSDVAT